jgi:hypothetical protein
MIKDLVTHLPRKLYTRTWIPKEIEGSGRKTFWIYGKRLIFPFDAFVQH